MDPIFQSEDMKKYVFRYFEHLPEEVYKDENL